jgi:hypothetical protein
MKSNWQAALSKIEWSNSDLACQELSDQKVILSSYLGYCQIRCAQHYHSSIRDPAHPPQTPYWNCIETLTNTTLLTYRHYTDAILIQSTLLCSTTVQAPQLSCPQQTADSRQKTADSRQQTAGSREQRADCRQQTTDRRQQTTDSGQRTLLCSTTVQAPQPPCPQPSLVP